jgi:hypothetical protein
MGRGQADDRERPSPIRPAWTLDGASGPARIRPKRTRTSSSAIVTAAVSGIAVIVAALIAAFIAFLANSQAERAASVQLKIAEQGQFTDRYTAAITNLGSRSIEVRLGGIYALQRLMQDSRRDQPTVVAVLCAFVRDQTASTTKTHGSQTSRVPTDVQAALTVVGTRNIAHDGQTNAVDTTAVDFDGAQLANARLGNLQLPSADFIAANLTGADLSFADLVGANLTGANLTGANLTTASLSSANLDGANLDGANLTAADLTYATLGGAWLINADLTGANLTGAHLDGANLTHADLTGARWPENTPAPEGWVRDPGTGQLTRANASH